MKVYSWFRRSLSSSPAMSTHAQDNNKKEANQAAEEELYGITDQLINLIDSFNLDTFQNFPLPDEHGADCGHGAAAASGNVRKDLSDWQEQHATLVLSRVKKLSQLRFKLCPRYLKEREFWKIYFTLVRSCLAEYELRAVRLEKLRSMTMENEGSPGKGAREVEMSEAKQAKSTDPATSLEQNMDF